MADEVIAYCVKEKMKKPMKDPRLEQMSNGKYAYKGTCSSCGTKMQVFVGAEKARQILASQGGGQTQAGGGGQGETQTEPQGQTPT